MRAGEVGRRTGCWGVGVGMGARGAPSCCASASAACRRASASAATASAASARAASASARSATISRRSSFGALVVSSAGTSQRCEESAERLLLLCAEMVLRLEACGVGASGGRLVAEEGGGAAGGFL